MRRITLACALLALNQLLQGCAPAVVAGSAVAAGAVVSDRRAAAVVLQDQRIEMKANDMIYSDEQIGGKVHINVISYNQSVLLTGEAPTAELSQQVEQIVRSIDKVKNVYNQIGIQAISTAESRFNDTWLTSSIKGWLLRSTNLDLGKVKIITERGDVFLMGLVTEEEATIAADIASRVDGVKQVNKVFEYVPASSINKADSKK